MYQRLVGSVHVMADANKIPCPLRACRTLLKRRYPSSVYRHIRSCAQRSGLGLAHGPVDITCPLCFQRAVHVSYDAFARTHYRGHIVEQPAPVIPGGSGALGNGGLENGGVLGNGDRQLQFENDHNTTRRGMRWTPSSSSSSSSGEHSSSSSSDHSSSKPDPSSEDDPGDEGDEAIEELAAIFQPPPAEPFHLNDDQIPFLRFLHHTIKARWTREAYHDYYELNITNINIPSNRKTALR
ncbi:uncharacterized protein EV422DRAFT_206652 [Fimicolochytrium jonesii]|uniref:uncharacterized protein n=1 Tax=Fimicolochytrium jonesii TaxID=1396493 RepID=UPI0022FF4522|nr:uncharacterized protein EV422DRAFT_206652 [Fimicolochytrium jonesii]KAI8817808.1 hypothetical protein EV422DRAFT_206652 [Fimicolochytrium jonesii]